MISAAALLADLIDARGFCLANVAGTLLVSHPDKGERLTPEDCETIRRHKIALLKLICPMVPTFHAPHTAAEWAARQCGAWAGEDNPEEED